MIFLNDLYFFLLYVLISDFLQYISLKEDYFSENINMISYILR
jgi:hypothetical protein